MDENQIIEIAFETIKESTEWELEDKVYRNWIDGVVTVVDNLLREIKKGKNEVKEK